MKQYKKTKKKGLKVQKSKKKMFKGKMLNKLYKFFN